MIYVLCIVYQTAHMLRMYRKDQPKLLTSYKQSKKDRQDPVKSRRPDLPITSGKHLLVGHGFIVQTKQRGQLDPIDLYHGAAILIFSHSNQCNHTEAGRKVSLVLFCTLNRSIHYCFQIQGT